MLANAGGRHGQSSGDDLSAVAAAKAEDSGRSPAADDGQPTAVNARGYKKGPLSWWVELSIYASMPLFHLHTFIALTIVLIVGLFFERPSELKFISNIARTEGIAGVGTHSQRARRRGLEAVPCVNIQAGGALTWHHRPRPNDL